MTKRGYLKEFEELVDKYFGKLESNYECNKIEVKSQRHEWWVKFKNQTTVITIIYEIGSGPWVMIGDAKQPFGKGSSLEWLLIELGVEKMLTIEEAFESKQHSRKEIEMLLQKKGKQLFMYGSDLIRGNFAIFPKMQERGERFAQECEEYLKKPKSFKQKNKLS